MTKHSYSCIQLLRIQVGGVKPSLIAWSVQDRERDSSGSKCSETISYPSKKNHMQKQRTLFLEPFSSVQLSCSVVSDSATPIIAAHQASLSITNSWSLLKLMSIKSVMPFSHIHLLPSPSPPAPNPSQHQSLFQSLFAWGGQSIGVSASTSVLPMNTQDWSLGWTGWISLQSKGLSRVFSNTTLQKHQFFRAQPSSQSNSHIHTWPLGKP